MLHLHRRVLCLGAVGAALAGCGGPGPTPVETRNGALGTSPVASADTFINSAFPDNNDGTSPSLYTGENGKGGAMRALVKFDLPAAWPGHVTVTRAVLTMVTRGTGLTETMPPTAATASLQALTVAWTEGTGFGDSTNSNTVGEACGTTGATWNQPDCAGGTPWTGGAASSAVSGTAAVPAALETTVTWDSDTAGNAGMVADVQSWIDGPTNNQGWRIASTSEGTMGEAQRFYAREVAGKGPLLTVTAACGAGLTENDGGCRAPPPVIDGAVPDTGAADTGQPPADGGGGGGGGCSCAVNQRPPTWTMLPSLGLAGLLWSRRRRRG